MNAAVKYTLARVGLFLVVLVVLLPVRMNLFLKLMIAVLASAGFSYFLLRKWRDEMAQDLANAAQRRRAEKDRLRAALAGDDDGGPGHQPATGNDDDPAGGRPTAS
jgi:hypothetical protein